MYTILLTAGILLLFLLVFIIAAEYDFDFLAGVSAIIMIIALIALIIMGLCVLTKDNDAKVDVAKFEAVRTTIDEQRTRPNSQLERVEMTKKIIDENEWLAEKKAEYVNPWDSWFTSELYLNVKSIE